MHLAPGRILDASTSTSTFLSASGTPFQMIVALATLNSVSADKQGAQAMLALNIQPSRFDGRFIYRLALSLADATAFLLSFF
jgi:hypothetical protein